MCRWTKSSLRNRGGCYKFTCYGIRSHQCMEFTPALACANRCHFCWRHNSHPTTKEWKWKVDEPKAIVDEAIQKHVDMINSFKGVPGVTTEKMKEGMNVRHCALSLVGEPITYPRINELLGYMHEKGISTFLVTNPQFPDCVEKLKDVTQFYFSIDAGTKEEYKKITRPLFEDYWERFLKCIDLCKERKDITRTVFRLTLVKQWNMEDVKSYVTLIERGCPLLIEIKGFTYCGSVNTSDLTMENVPFHEEVKKFSESICSNLNDYELACQHEHSCLVLIAHKKLKINGEWHTWIDFDKFSKLSTSGKPYTYMDYIEKTPSWALYNSTEKGFDPNQKRFKKNVTEHVNLE